MSTVTIIFVSGHSIIDTVINTVSHGQYSHVAIKILEGVVEALGVKDIGDKYPGVWLHDAEKYDNNPDVKMIDVDLPDIAGAEAEANNLIGTLYGYLDCINGGYYDITGKQLTNDGKITANCSETVTLILRAGGLAILPELSADYITPNDLYRELTGNVG